MHITFKRLVLLGSIVVVAFVTYMAYQLLTSSGPITISPQTTVITEPLAHDGLPDYAAYALGRMKEGVTPDNNGAIPFLQAMWPVEISPIARQAICTELGMDMPDSHGMKYPYGDPNLVDELVKWYKQHWLNDDEVDDSTLRAWVQEQLIDRATYTPWTADSASPVVEWLTEHESHYNLLAEAARRDKYYLPSETLLTDPNTSFVVVLLPHVQTLRSAVRCVALRANYHIGSSNLDAAWDDCQTIYGLADTCKQQFLVGELVSIACENIGHQTAAHILGSDDLSEELAREMHRFYANHTPRDNMRPAIDRWERLMFVTAVLEMSGRRKSASTDPNSPANQLGPFAALANLAIDWDLLLEIGNQWYDEIVAAMELSTHEKRQAALDAFDAKISQQTKITAGKVIGSAVSRTSRSKNMGNVLSGLLLPAVTAAIDAEDRANAMLQLHQVAVALAVYRLENGEYPDSLDTLVPTLVDQLPVDVYDNALVYQKTKDGFLLYSLGKNGNDDGGSHSAHSIYKGYETVDTEEEDRALRKLLGEPPDEDYYEYLVPPQDADDWSLRLPLLEKPLPKYEPAAE